MPNGTILPSAAVWVVRLTRHGVPAPGAVGPFPREDDALEWVTMLLDGVDGWTWTIETVVSPDVLPSRCAPRRRHLHLVS